MLESEGLKVGALNDSISNPVTGLQAPSPDGVMKHALRVSLSRSDLAEGWLQSDAPRQGLLPIPLPSRQF